MKVKVDCYAGYRAEEMPKRFWIKHKEIKVEKIINQWLAPESRNYRILGDDSATYTLQLNTDSRNWELISFDSYSNRQTRKI